MSPGFFTRIWALQPEQHAPTRPKHMVAVDVLDEKPQVWKLCADCMVHTGTEDSLQAIKDLGGVAAGLAMAPNAFGRAYGSAAADGSSSSRYRPTTMCSCTVFETVLNGYPDHGL